MKLESICESVDDLKLVYGYMRQRMRRPGLRELRKLGKAFENLWNKRVPRDSEPNIDGFESVTSAVPNAPAPVPGTIQKTPQTTLFSNGSVGYFRQWVSVPGQTRLEKKWYDINL